jgi:hypothetical protein
MTNRVHIVPKIRSAKMMTDRERLEKKRATKRRNRRDERRRSRPVVRQLQRIKTKDSASNMVSCRVCSEKITLDVDKWTSCLVRLNMDGSLHRHQDG